MEEEYNTCFPDMKINISKYLKLISFCPYREQSRKNKKLINQIYRHIQDCEACNNKYLYIKDIFVVAGELQTEEFFFSSGELKTIQRNENYLESILNQGKI